MCVAIITSHCLQVQVLAAYIKLCGLGIYLRPIGTLTMWGVIIHYSGPQGHCDVQVSTVYLL